PDGTADRDPVQGLVDQAPAGLARRREGDDLVARAGRLRQAAQRSEDVDADARPGMRQRRDVDDRPHRGGLYAKSRKWAPSSRVSGFAPPVTRAGIAVRPTVKSTTQRPSRGRSGTVSTVSPVGCTLARPAGRPSTRARTRFGREKSASSLCSVTATVPP